MTNEKLIERLEKISASLEETKTDSLSIDPYDTVAYILKLNIELANVTECLLEHLKC